MPRPENSSFNSGEINRKKPFRVKPKKRTVCEELTGLTREELIEKQRNMRADVYKRVGRKVPS